MGAESLGRLWGREDPSMKGGTKFSGRVAGRVYWQMRRVRRQFPGVAVLVILVGRRFVECCCLGLPMKSLGNRCRRTFGWR